MLLELQYATNNAALMHISCHLSPAMSTNVFENKNLNESNYIKSVMTCKNYVTRRHVPLIQNLNS
jgi:hypothetical protein